MLRGGLMLLSLPPPRKFDRAKLGVHTRLHYFTCMRRFLQICLIAILAPLPALCEQVQGRLIVQRTDDAIELYFHVPSRDVATVFGYDPAPILNAAGHVDFDLFFEDTSPFADQIMTRLPMQVGAKSAQPEGLSFMLHPVENKVEFSTPWDALLTITGCTVAGEADPIGLQATDAYFGAIIYPTDGHAPLVIDLPTTGRGDLVLQVLDFNGFDPAGTRVITVADGGQIHLTPADVSAVNTASLPILAVIAAGVMFFGWRVFRVRHVSA